MGGGPGCWPVSIHKSPRQRSSPGPAQSPAARVYPKAVKTAGPGKQSTVAEWMGHSGPLASNQRWDGGTGRREPGRARARGPGWGHPVPASQRVPNCSLPPRTPGAGSALLDASPSSAGCSLLEGGGVCPRVGSRGLSHCDTPGPPAPAPAGRSRPEAPVLPATSPPAVTHSGGPASDLGPTV